MYKDPRSGILCPRVLKLIWVSDICRINKYVLWSRTVTSSSELMEPFQEQGRYEQMFV